MKLTDLFIRRPVFAIVVNVAIAVIGLVALPRLSIRELPAFDLPMVSVSTALPGASAAQVERQVTTVVEQAVGGVPGVETVSSVSSPGFSRVDVKFAADTNSFQAASDVRAKVAAVGWQLPAEATSPVVQQTSVDAVPVVYLALTGDRRSAVELTDLAERILTPELGGIPGVASAQVMGSRRVAMRIRFDPIALAAYGLTIDDARFAISGQNSDAPAGTVQGRDADVPVVALTTLSTPEAFGAIVVKKSGDALVRLRDVATVAAEPADATSAVMIDGRPAVAVGLLRQSAANPLEIGRAVQGRLKGLQASLPADVRLDVVFDRTVYIARSVDEVFQTVFSAVALVIAVIFLFLASWRASAVTLVTIPLSLVGTLAFIWIAGFSLNTFSLLAIVLAVGLVVDDAIIDVENVQRHIEGGRTPLDAAFVGSREIGFAVVATTLTLAVVYLPVGLMPGMVGSLLREFAFTLAAAILISGYISRTLSPMMCSRLLAAGRRSAFGRFVDTAFGKLENGYRSLLGAALAARWVVVVVVLSFVGFGVTVAGTLGGTTAPNEDEGYVLATFTAPTGSNLAVMEAQGRAIERVFDTVPERAHSLTILGTTANNAGMAILVLKPWEERRRSAEEVSRSIRDGLRAIPGADIAVLETNPLAAAGQQPVQLVIRSTGSVEDLAAAAEAVVARARTLPGLIDVSSDLKMDTRTVTVGIRRDVAAELGVDPGTIARTLSSVFGGQRAGRFSEGDRLYDVILDLDRKDAADAADIDRLQVRAASGRLVPLASVVTLSETVGTAMLPRFGQERAARITAGLAPGATLAAASAALHAEAAAMLPPGMSIALDGAAGDQAKTAVQSALVFAAALLFVYLFLAAQFESFRDPAIVLAVVPLAVFGGLVALGLVGGTLNLYSVIGLVTLVGLIAKHGILITEFANQLRDRGTGFAEAIREAAALRLRPILMTTIATVIGALPLLMATGPGANGRIQLGAVMIGGMLAGTLLSLFVVPVVYSALSRRVREPLVEAPADAEGEQTAPVAAAAAA